MTAKLRSRCCTSKLCGLPKYAFWILLFAVFATITVPVAVMFGRKKHSWKSKVLIPLYVYPAQHAWDPLYQAISSNPNLLFTVVINPNSGPGLNPLPDSNFTAGINILNSYPNVHLAGYVSTNYSNRDINQVIQDIQAYSRWKHSGIVGITSTNGTNQTNPIRLGIRDIFLDETPREWTPEAGSFYGRVAGVIRSQPGLGPWPSIIHNPGTVPSPNYLPFLSQVVIFEGSYDTYKSAKFDKNITAFTKTTQFPRYKLASIVHSLPENTTHKESAKLIKDLAKVSGSVFITGLSVDYYSKFWSGFGGWVSAMKGK
ncbi:Spherulation-specific family 4 [Amylocarpus encephaloides]|uniref:Spherulation-specific family 4 n=1 Tax=Amylocarpus encephaloides TaxID=45428 RepID=A0A9P7YJP2_9HELO|nr:Spherulation-specific family 4 [Amylocarpus encephaloides]